MSRNHKRKNDRNGVGKFRHGKESGTMITIADTIEELESRLNTVGPFFLIRDETRAGR